MRGTTLETPWQMKAACRGPQAFLFFPPTTPERKDERDVRESRAKAICATCPVARQCLDFALETREQHGIWGAKTEAERRQLLAVAG